MLGIILILDTLSLSLVLLIVLMVVRKLTTGTTKAITPQMHMYHQLLVTLMYYIITILVAIPFLKATNNSVTLWWRISWSVPGGGENIEG